MFFILIIVTDILAQVASFPLIPKTPTSALHYLLFQGISFLMDMEIENGRLIWLLDSEQLPNYFPLPREKWYMVRRDTTK